MCREPCQPGPHAALSIALCQDAGPHGHRTNDTLGVQGVLLGALSEGQTTDFCPGMTETYVL